MTGTPDTAATTRPRRAVDAGHPDSFASGFALPDGRRVGAGEPVLLVAELSGNHRQDYRRAADLVHAAAEAGADAVKLQTYTPATLTIDCDAPWFRVTGDGPWSGRTLWDLYGEASTPWEWHEDLFTLARDLGLEVFSTPFDHTAVDFLETLSPPMFKIASFELVDLDLVQRVGATGRPTLMSTGMATREEIERATRAFAETGNRNLVLLKCTSAYPADLSDMNLRAMTRLRELFGVPVGLSDHCLANRAAVAAAALGACVIEKHLTLDRSDGGVDAGFSLEPDEFSRMAREVRETEQALGGDGFGAGIEESANIVFRRSIFVVADIGSGEELTRDNVRVIRPGHGLPPHRLPDVLGRRATEDLRRGTPLQPEHVR